MQDILWTAHLNPKRRMDDLSDVELKDMFTTVKGVLGKMIAQGGRDTENDLFGHAGGYKTILCKNTMDNPCPECGSKILKETYLGGAVYYCPHCQKL